MKPTPNYHLMLRSAITGLQNAYSEYKEARIEAIRGAFIDEDGRMAILSGYEERQKRIERAEAEIVRLADVVIELRNKIDSKDGCSLSTLYKDSKNE